MYSKQTTVLNKLGLHARPASEFVLLARKFKSDVFIQNLDDGSAPTNAKSINNILAGNFAEGANVKVVAEGDDEIVAADKLVALIDSGFGE